MPKFSESPKAKFWFLAWVCWISILFWLSLMRLEPVPVEGWLAWDKLHHATAYGLMTWLGGRALSHLCGSRLGWLSSAGFAILIGAALELLQTALTSYRSAEWGDLLADGIGALLVCSVALSVEKRTRRKGRP